ncbi:MAG: glycosyltransferase family 4 protein [Candidatus Aminicenantaceae bacterium]
MRLGFDIRPFLKQETGVGIYFKNLLFHLAQIDHTNHYFLFSSSLKDRFPIQKVPPFDKKNFIDLRLPVRMVNFLWHRLSWPPMDYFFRTELDLTHSPTPMFLPTRGKKIVTVYDLFFIDFPWMSNKEARKYFVNKIKDTLFKADGVVAISQFTKKQVVERFAIDEKKVKVIYLGLDHRFYTDISPEEIEKIRERFSLPSSFILFVGAIEPRKNLLNLIEALKIIHTKYEKIALVIVGRKGQAYKDLVKKVKQSELEPWVRIEGYLPDKEVRIFYRLASVLAFPSLHEGFGLPLLEAMASGLPVVTSRSSAIPEIAQDATLYFHPEEPEDIADKAILVLKDEDLRQDIQAKGKKRALDFNWRVTATETLRFYESLFQK